MAKEKKIKEEVPAIADELTERQEAFCNEYLKDFNATQAYLRAGFSAKTEDTAAVLAWRLLRIDKISARIDELKQERSERLKIDADWVLIKLASIANANFIEVMEAVREDVEPFEIGDGEPSLNTLSQNFTFKDLKSIPPELQMVIKQVKYTRYGLEVTFEEKKWAMEMIAKHIGFFEKHNEQKRPAGMTKEELEAELTRIREQRGKLAG